MNVNPISLLLHYLYACVSILRTHDFSTFLDTFFQTDFFFLNKTFAICGHNIWYGRSIISKL